MIRDMITQILTKLYLGNSKLSRTTYKTIAKILLLWVTVQDSFTKKKLELPEIA